MIYTFVSGVRKKRKYKLYNTVVTTFINYTNHWLQTVDWCRNRDSSKKVITWTIIIEHQLFLKLLGVNCAAIFLAFWKHFRNPMRINLLQIFLVVILNHWKSSLIATPTVAWFRKWTYFLFNRPHLIFNSFSEFYFV